MVNYVRLSATSERLITKNGRDITFYKVSSNPGEVTKPWNGPASLNPIDSVTLKGVFAPPNTVRQFGLTALGEGLQVDDVFTFVETICIFFPGDHDIKQFRFVEDRGSRWNVVAFQLLRPADLQLVGYLGLRR